MNKSSYKTITFFKQNEKKNYLRFVRITFAMHPTKFDLVLAPGKRAACSAPPSWSLEEDSWLKGPAVVRLSL